MPIKKDFILELSKEEQKEINDQINKTLILLIKYAVNFAEMYYRDDPNMTPLVFNKLLLNYILNLVTRAHKVEQQYDFELLDQIDIANMRKVKNE